MTRTPRPSRWLLALIPSLLLSLPASAAPVAPTAAPATGNSASSNQDVRIELRIDNTQPYVQAQAILSVRVLHRIALYDDSRLLPPQVEDLRIEPLGAVSTSQTRIDEQRFGVIEQRFALFPQRAGKLVLPPLQFIATSLQTDASGQSRPQRLRLSSPPLQLQVRPRPQDYPEQASWLPASQLVLSERWIGATPLHSGDAITRVIELQVDGLPASALPDPQPDSGNPQLRHYHETPRQNEERRADGLHVRRSDSMALVPLRDGSLLLPAVEIPWWNTRDNRLEIARLPERRLEVLPSEQSASAQPAPAAASSAPPPALWPWQLATLTLAGTSLLGFGLWWRARRRAPAGRSHGPSSASTLEALRRSCQNNDAPAARKALDLWARQQPETLARMAARDIPLAAALDELNGALYRENAGHWEGDALWQTIQRLTLHNLPQGEHSDGSLPPLYPH